MNIIACANGKRPSADEVDEKDYMYSWVDPVTGEVMTLNNIEKAIFKKYINDKQPIFHYPVITHTLVYHCPKGSTYKPKIVEDLDEVKDKPEKGDGEDCPFDLNNYKWLKTGSNITCTLNADESKDMQIVETWWGAYTDKDAGQGWDGNFYKNGTIFEKESETTWKLGNT